MSFKGKQVYACPHTYACVRMHSPLPVPEPLPCTCRGAISELSMVDEQMFISVPGLCDDIILSSFMWLINQKITLQGDNHQETQYRLWLANCISAQPSNMTSNTTFKNGFYGEHKSPGLICPLKENVP